MDSTFNKDELLDEAALYESILQRMPQDSFSLERLVDIWSQCGDKAKEAFYRHQLELLQNNEELMPMAPSPSNLSASKPLRTVISEHHSRRSSSFPRPNVSEPSMHLGESQLLVDESWKDKRVHMELLIRLLEWKLIDATKYTKLVGLLSFIDFSCVHDAPQGALHLLRASSGEEYEQTLKALSMTSGLNRVDLLEFSTTDVISELPRELVYNLEVVVFSKCKDEVSVAMLNPYNTKLKNLLEDYYALPVEFYLTDVDSFDSFIKGESTNGTR